MDRLTEGDFILAVISDKYLRSEYCMYELFRIYRNCADKPDRFLGKVIPFNRIPPERRPRVLADFVPARREGVELAATFDLIMEVTPRG